MRHKNDLNSFEAKYIPAGEKNRLKHQKRSREETQMAELNI